MQNMGILCIFAFGLLGALLFFTQYNRRTARDTKVTLYKEGSDGVPVSQVVDEENVAPGNLNETREGLDTADNGIAGIVQSEKPGRADIFSWKNIQYEVPISGGEMGKLLDDVSGYVAPGQLTALMGETGAGKVGIRGVGCVGADRKDVLTDSVIECTRSTHLGGCCARYFFAERTCAPRGLPGPTGVRSADGYAHRRVDGSRGPFVLGESSPAPLRSDG
jgi:hypothetical protein